MNFFGHAVVGLWRSDDARFVLGAMLPDLCGMLGIRASRAEDAKIAELSAGIEFHHRTDAAFHGCDRFVALCSQTVEALTAQGVGRGTSRAVGHVGTELLLDGLLSTQRDARAVYTQALTLAVDERLSESVLVDPDEQARMHKGLDRLRRAPIPEAYTDPVFVADRLQWILSSRPRLAMQPHDGPIVQHELTRLAQDVSASWTEILDQVRARLAL
jgi:hypothetical protein